MTASDPVIADHVVLQCPACGACESTEAGALADAPMIVCRECGETWPAGPKRTKRSEKLIRNAVDGGEVIDAKRRPLITYSDGSNKAWAAKMEGDFWPTPPRQRHLPMMAAAVAATFFLVAFFAAREAAVAILPDLAGLYAAIGLPVNVDGLSIEDVAAERTAAAGREHVSVRGTIRNVSGAERAIPPLSAILYDSALVPAGSYGFEPPIPVLGVGETTAFLLEFDNVPPQAAEVVIRFHRRGGVLPLVRPERSDTGTAAR